MAIKKCSSVITKSAEIAFQAIHHDDIQRHAPYLQQIYVLCLRGIPLSKTTTNLHDDIIVLLDVTPRNFAVVFFRVCNQNILDWTDGR